MTNLALIYGSAACSQLLAIMSAILAPSLYSCTNSHRLVRIPRVCCVNKKYVLRNVYLPNAVAFHTPLSKYLIVIVMTLN